MTTPYPQHVPQQYPPQGVAPYVSPIPVRRATFPDALASEWTKIRSVRSTVWTLGVMVVLVVGIGLLSVVAVGSSDGSDTPVLSYGFFGVLLGSIPVITLGVMTVASEYGTGMIRTTLTACPSRSRVLAAKSVVFFALVFGITLVTTALVGALQSSTLGGTSPTGEDWLRATLGVSLYIATLGLLSLAIGSLIRHSAGAITIMIGVVLLPLVLAMFMFSSTLADLQQALFEYSIPNQLSVFYDVSVTDSGPSGWEPLWILAGVTAVALGGAFAALEKRDV